jgi:hypothetical protein
MGKANSNLVPAAWPLRFHIVLMGLSVDRDGAECGAFDLHGLILGS